MCDGYADLRENVDLRMEPELVDFFQRVMDRRREMKWDKADKFFAVQQRSSLRLCSQIFDLLII